jgi:hypothetical protein
MVRIPRRIRYAAPAIFTTVNACDDARSTADRPRAAAVAWTSKPEHVPADVASPDGRPPANVFRATRVMSGPGVTTTSVATAMNPARSTTRA